MASDWSQERSQEETFLSRPPPLPYAPLQRRLRKPIAIPATDAKFGQVSSPFLRAYPLVLDEYQVSKESFLAFLDDLNRVAVANPPVRILGLAGTLVSFVPLQTTQIVGNVVSTAADVAAYGISKGRTELCLREANQKIFGPRGLKVEIAKLDALAKLAGIPILDEMGKVRSDTSLLVALEDSPQELASPTVQQRRLQALSPWIEQLEVAVLPQVNTPTSALGKWSAAASERQRRSGEASLMKSRLKAREDFNEDMVSAQEDFDDDMRKLERKEEKARAKASDNQYKLDKKLRKVEKKREKARDEYDREVGKVEQSRIKDNKEEKAMRKILWLIIRNIDDPSGPGPNPDVPSYGGY